jgi:hypothetical protein
MASVSKIRPVIEWPTATHNGLAFIKRIHRGTDAAVCLTRKVDGKWEELGSAPVASLDRLPRIGSTDIYASINSTVIRDGYQGYGVHGETGLVRTGRKSHQMFWLNCAHVDIDAPKKNREAGAAYCEAIQYLLEHGLPLPTIVIFSGNGLWLIWEFRLPINGDPDRRSLLRRINDNLQKRLAHLGADPKSKDVARVCRIMGSLNSSCGRRVRWEEVPGGHSVDLMFLASAFEVPAYKTALTQAEEKKPITARNPLRRAAGYARWISRRLDLLKVMEYRGMISQGQRHAFMFYLSAVSKCAGIPAREIRQECLEIGQTRCFPAYAGQEVERAVSGGLSTVRNITDECIRTSDIAITQEECKVLNLALGREKRTRRTISKKAEIQDRRRAIVALMAGTYIPLRRMTVLLGERGFHVERGTVAGDYRFLGISRSGLGDMAGASVASPRPRLSAARDQEQKFVHFCAGRTFFT